MDNILNYYYKLKQIDIIKMNNNYLIMDNNDYSYLLYEVDKNINLNNNINVLSKINNSYYGDLILNINNSYISKIDDKYFVLIRLKGIINELITLKLNIFICLM